MAGDAKRNGASVNRRSADAARLRQRVRALSNERRDLRQERDAYLQALMAIWKHEAQQDNWSDFDPKDYRFTLADIFAEFEKEEGACLPRHLSTRSSIRPKSKKSSKISSGKRRKSRS